MKKFTFLTMLALLMGAITTSNAQNALHFDGSNDHVQSTFSGVLGTTSRTFEAWVKVDSGAPAANLCIVDYGTNAVGSRNTFSVSGSRGLTFISGGTNANIGSTSGVVPEGVWTHVAFVLDNGTGYLYVNGSQVGTGNLSTVNTPTGQTNLRIGQRVSGGSIPFEGAIDEVRIWNVARSATDIANNRNAEFCSISPNLVAYFNFNQGVAGGNNSGLTNLHNAVLNANGTLNNFSLSGSSSNWVSGVQITPGLSVSKSNVSACDSMVSPSGFYTWTSSGSYYDTIPNANSCDSIMRFGLTINNSIYETVVDTSCDPYVSPSGNYTYTSSGIYFDTTLTSKGCLHVYELNLELKIIDTSVNVSGLTLTSNHANALYTWLDCNDNFAPIPGAISQSYNVTANGSYAVRVSNIECTDTSSCIDVNWIGINENSQNSIQVYPNPSSGEIFIKGMKTGNVSILDMKGNVVYTRRIDASNRSILLPSSVVDGMYLIHFWNDRFSSREKLFIIKD